VGTCAYLAEISYESRGGMSVIEQIKTGIAKTPVRSADV